MTNTRYVDGITVDDPVCPRNTTEPAAHIPPAFQSDLEHLEDIKRKLDEAIGQASRSVGRFEADYLEFKRYMTQNRGEIDPHEMLQNEVALKRIDTRGAFAVQHRARLTSLRNSPYFARIDFREASSSAPATFYIGRNSFSCDGELLVSDWRSPIAGMFYDCEIGVAGYESPAGPIDGELTRKRQFRIRNGEMEYALESSLAIQDEVLRRELSRPSGVKMHAIIATIQKEQNLIIRNERAQALLVQGVAGSGKTSIALHRIAYLLYRFKDRFSAQDVTIISPNKVFGNHISDVLPELGEEPVHEMTFADIARTQLEGIVRFEPDSGPYATREGKWAERVRFKSSRAFVERLTEYLDRALETVFQSSDWTHGKCVAEGAWIRSRFDAYHMYPVKQRLLMVADDLRDRFESGNIAGERMPTVRSIARQLDAMLTVKSALPLYRRFYAETGVPDMFVMPEKKTLEWADVFPFLLVLARFEGLRESQSIRHLVIDEMQDYTPVQHAVMDILFKCPKTILGDFGQSTNPHCSHNLNDVARMYRRAEVVELNRSYRSTREIMALAKRIRNIPSLEVVDRYGEPPIVLACRDEQDELAQIRERIDAFRNNGSVTLGIIAKTDEEARRFHDVLSRDYEAHLIAPDCARFAGGISVASVHMSKGLEFDEVIIVGATRQVYCTERDRALLYVACTRALHRLCLTHTGEATAFLG
jgi:DNA helicase-2/ATP-dependent DNA helicase PcrA